MEEMEDYQLPKDPIGSNRSKYNRSRTKLRHSLEQFIMASNARLSPSKGRVNKRESIENLLYMSEELLAHLPESKETQFNISHEEFILMLEEGVQDTMEIINEPLDMDRYKYLLESIKELKQKLSNDNIG